MSPDISSSILIVDDLTDMCLVTESSIVFCKRTNSFYFGTIQNTQNIHRQKCLYFRGFGRHRASSKSRRERERKRETNKSYFSILFLFLKRHFQI